MPNPYELTALEDPADMYNALPRGGGRIAYPSGDVRTFQFNPPTPADQNAALRAAAARAQQFDVLQRNAQEAAKDKQEMEDLQANLRVENAAKAVQMAKDFQARRAYQRERELGEVEGLTSAEAGARAASRYPWALGSGAGSGAAAMMLAGRDIPQPSFGETPEGIEYVQSGRYGERVQFPPRQPVEKTATPLAQLNYWRGVEQSLMNRMSKGQPPDPGQLAQVRKVLAGLQQQLPVAIEMPPPPAFTNQALLRFKKDKTGKAVQY